MTYPLRTGQTNPKQETATMDRTDSLGRGQTHLGQDRTTWERTDPP